MFIYILINLIVYILFSILIYITPTNLFFVYLNLIFNCYQYHLCTQLNFLENV